MANLATPTVQVDDNTIQIKPGSLSYKLGRGDFNVRAQQAGNIVTTVNNKNAETQIGMVKFTLLTTADNLEALGDWLAARDANGSTVSFFDGNIQVAYRNMVLATEPEVSTGAEGEFEVEFMGPAAIS